MNDLRSVGFRFTIQDLEHTVCSEHHIVRIRRLRNSVSIKEESAAVLEHELIFPVGYIRHTADNKAMSVLQKLEFSVLLPDDRIFMACIGRDNVACRNRQDAQPHGNKHILLVILADLVIDPLKDLIWKVAEHSIVVDKDLRHHHEESCRNTFA